MVQRNIIKLQLINLDVSSYHLIAQGEISGLPVNLVIDTGASRSVFDIVYLSEQIKPEKEGGKIHSAGISAEKVETFMARTDEFILGKLKLKDFPLILIDFSKINKVYNKVAGIKIHGLLGSDFLHTMNAVIDFRKLKMSLTTEILS